LRIYQGIEGFACVVNTAVIIGAATGIVKEKDAKILLRMADTLT